MEHELDFASWPASSRLMKKFP